MTTNPRCTNLVRTECERIGVLATLLAVRQGVDDAITRNGLLGRFPMLDNALGQLNRVINLNLIEASQAYCRKHDCDDSPLTMRLESAVQS